jgi:hypothetical protein
MKTRLLLFLVLGSLMAKAQTIEVSGTQSGVWDAETVLVKGDVKVQDSLRIMPGTTVVFQGFFQIIVENNASLKAIGTENDSITFTVTDTTGFHVFNSGRGGWNGIRLNEAGASQFDYCRMQYGKAALDNDQDGGALRIYGCNAVEISNSTLFCNFSREHGGALNAENSKVVIHDCMVSNNLTYSEIDTIYFMYGGGLRFINCKVDITDTDFCHNSGESAIGGALSLDSCAVNIDRCRFEYNYGINGAGLYLIRSYDTPCNISNSLFANNISGHFGGGLAISDSSPLVSNLTVVNNQSVGVNCGGIFFYQYSSPVVRNCIIYGNANSVPLEEPVQMWSWTYEGYAPEFHNCLVQFGLDNISNHEVITVYENCIDEDPLFVDSEHGDFHLTANSPCINVGLTQEDDFAALDLDKSWRVCNSGIDMGAFEYSATSIQETIQDDRFVRIFGNPVTTSSYAEIDLDKPCRITARVVSMDGKSLFNKDLGMAQKGTFRFAIGEMFASLPSGSYLLIITDSTGRPLVAKVVK